MQQSYDEEREQNRQKRKVYAYIRAYMSGRPRCSSVQRGRRRADCCRRQRRGPERGSGRSQSRARARPSAPRAPCTWPTSASGRRLQPVRPPHHHPDAPSSGGKGEARSRPSGARAPALRLPGAVNGMLYSSRHSASATARSTRRISKSSRCAARKSPMAAKIISASDWSPHTRDTPCTARSEPAPPPPPRPALAPRVGP